MARPRKEGEPLDQTFSFKLTKADRQMWEAKIAKSGMSRSEFFRHAVRDNQTVVAPPLRGERESIKPRKPQSRHVQKLLFCISMISNNTNQLAHAVNAARKAGQVSPALYEAILSELLIIADKAKALDVQ